MASSGQTVYGMVKIPDFILNLREVSEDFIQKVLVYKLEILTTVILKDN